MQLLNLVAFYQGGFAFSELVAMPYPDLLEVLEQAEKVVAAIGRARG